MPGQDVKGKVVQTDVIHERIHQGRLYSANISDIAVGSGLTLSTLVRTPAAPPVVHGRFVFSVGGTCQVSVFRDPTVTVDGTPVIPFNHNDIQATATPVLVFQNPTFTPGDLLGSSDVVLREDSQTSPFLETVFRPSTDYVVQVTNSSGSAAAVRTQFIFYQVNSIDEL